MTCNRIKALLGFICVRVTMSSNLLAKTFLTRGDHWPALISKMTGYDAWNGLDYLSIWYETICLCDSNAPIIKILKRKRIKQSVQTVINQNMYSWHKNTAIHRKQWTGRFQSDLCFTVDIFSDMKNEDLICTTDKTWPIYYKARKHVSMKLISSKSFMTDRLTSFTPK